MSFRYFSTSGLRLFLTLCLSLPLFVAGCGLVDSNREGGDGDGNTGDDNQAVVITPVDYYSA